MEEKLEQKDTTLNNGEVELKVMENKASLDDKKE